MQLVSLFSGAGGLDLGLEAAGFKTKLCVENDKDCQRTLSLNRKKWKIANPPDIFLLTPEEIKAQAGLKTGELDLLAGGPPCQPFSKASFWRNGDSRRLKDPRAQTLNSYMHIVEELLPKVILLENVEGIRFNKKDEGLSLLKRRFEEINKKKGTNYKPFVWGVNAADYGVPQIRRRVLVIASREGLDFVPPPITHGTEFSPHMTAWDAIGGLEAFPWKEVLKPRGNWTDLLSSIPEGHNYLWHTDKGGGVPLFGYRTRYWSFLLKLSRSMPSWTIPAQPGPAVGPFHWSNRLLAIRELARLQAFPDDWNFVGSRQSVQKQIGNAVPPLLGEIVGQEIARQLLHKKSKTGDLKFALKKRSMGLPKMKMAGVPSKYQSRIGTYAPHPGTGKGPGALLRS